MPSKTRGPSGNRDIVTYLRETNPAMTLQEIGSHVGISRERVRQILVSEHLETRSTARIPIPMPPCRRCGNFVPYRKRIFCSSICQHPTGRTIVMCHSCGKEISLMTSIYKTRQARAAHIHCSRTCRDNSRRGHPIKQYE